MGRWQGVLAGSLCQCIIKNAKQVVRMAGLYIGATISIVCSFWQLLQLASVGRCTGPVCRNSKGMHVVNRSSVGQGVACKLMGLHSYMSKKMIKSTFRYFLLMLYNQTVV